MHYGELKDCDIANGTGVRVTLFVSGCTNACEGCFQPETWDFCYGKPFTEETEDEILRLLEPAYISGLTILGGEPFEPENQRVLVPFLKRFKERYPRKDLWVFSGFRYDDEMTVPGNHANCEVTQDFLDMIDVLVDGRFVLNLKDLRLRYRGSSNQRIIDMRRTRTEGRVVLWDETRAYN